MFTICAGCDRGQRYCGARCRTLARRDQVRAAGRRYQTTDHGRTLHRHRQRRYRDRQTQPDVTHQGWTNELETAITQSAANVSMHKMWASRPVGRSISPHSAQPAATASSKKLRFYMIGNKS